MLDRILQMFPFGIVAGSVLSFLLLDLCDVDGVFLYVPLAMIAGVGLFFWMIFSRKPPRLFTLLALVILCAASFILCRRYDDIRVAIRWALWSKDFKAAVLAQPVRYRSEFKHVKWDVWGWGGSGATTAYVVFDPDNSLAKAAESDPSDMVIIPLPCSAAKVRRLEKSWYAVVLYTGSTWDRN